MSYLRMSVCKNGLAKRSAMLALQLATKAKQKPPYTLIRNLFDLDLGALNATRCPQSTPPPTSPTKLKQFWSSYSSVYIWVSTRKYSATQRQPQPLRLHSVKWKQQSTVLDCNVTQMQAGVFHFFVSARQGNSLNWKNMTLNIYDSRCSTWNTQSCKPHMSRNGNCTIALWIPTFSDCILGCGKGSWLNVVRFSSEEPISNDVHVKLKLQMFSKILQQIHR